MSLAKEWLLPLARVLIKNDAKGPVYVLGDQFTWFSYEYAFRKLKKTGLLRNAAAPKALSAKQSSAVSFRTFMGMLGFEEFYDIDINGLADLTWDLAQPLSTEFHGRAGLVIDIGTCEHIFDLPQSFSNIVELLRPGGIVVHLSPFSWYNHGFVNFNPVLFREFYEHNHFQLLDHVLIWSPFDYTVRVIADRFGLEPLLSRFSSITFTLDDENPTLTRFANHVGLSARMMFLFAAKKSMDNLPPSFPCQSIYRPRSPER